MNRIRKLPEETINRIAAGEIIVRPSHAIKELIENSLDAGAQTISIVVEAGGLDLLEITDNGCGIHKDDLGIVCQRFTTSKLKTIDDLKSLACFGFRGEALSSLSLVSRLSITTVRSEDDPQAYTCSYINGVPIKPMTPVAFDKSHGTRIIAESLFYNLPVRRRSLQPSEEYHRVLRVVEQYALHFHRVSFSCRTRRSLNTHRKSLNASCTLDYPELFTETVGDCSSPVQEPHHEGTENGAGWDAVERIFGRTLANSVIPFHCSKPMMFQCSGWILRPGLSDTYKKLHNTFILFINNRLVESPVLKRMVEACIDQHCNIQGKVSRNRNWVYLSIQVPTDVIDVNVHPSKKHVLFLYEEQLLDAVNSELTTLLRDTSLGELLPKVARSTTISQEPATKEFPKEARNHSVTPEKPKSNASSATPAKRCRIDCSQSRLKTFLYPSSPIPCDMQQIDKRAPQLEIYWNFFLKKNNQPATLRLNPSEHPLVSIRSTPVPVNDCRAVAELKSRLRENADTRFPSPFRSFYVGAIDVNKVFLQCSNTLLLVNLQELFKYAVYQSIIHRLCCLPFVTFDPPLPIPMNNIVLPPDSAVLTVQSVTHLLNVLFSVEIDAEKCYLLRFPLCCGTYFPGRYDGTIINLAEQLLTLGLNSKTECDFIDCISTCLADYYATLPTPSQRTIPGSHDLSLDIVELVFYPCVDNFPLFLIPQRCFQSTPFTIQEVTTVDALYRVFERC